MSITLDRTNEVHDRTGAETVKQLCARFAPAMQSLKPLFDAVRSPKLYHLHEATKQIADKIGFGRAFPLMPDRLAPWGMLPLADAAPATPHHERAE